MRGLEVFEAVARTGSVARAADELAVSVSTVSQQLKKLEESFGTDLVDHNRRPLILTAAGLRFKRRAEVALAQMRYLQMEVQPFDLKDLRSLHLAVVDDFDYRITPIVAAKLADAVRDCSFLLQTRTSHELYDLVASGRVDFAVAASPIRSVPNALELPILEDPFVFIVPKGRAFDADNWQHSLADLPLLRIDRNLRIAETIDFELRQRNLDLPSRFEFDSMTTINTLVASGQGWAITTILSLLQSDDALSELDCYDIPFGAFSRTISGLAATHTAPNTAGELAELFRKAVENEMINPICAQLPWLQNRFRILGR
ncbi:MAG: LysR family transcriptional regulator [Deltaproteobacteria bacterium]